MSERTQTCPRRMQDIGPWARGEGLDQWTTGHGLVGQDQVGESCSFCGSLHPDRFMELVREGWIVGPTDKSYKAYLGRPLTDDEKAARKERWLSDPSSVFAAIREKLHQEGKSEAEVAEALEQAWQAGPGAVMDSAGQEAKFYYQHLSDEQQAEFIALYNAQQMKIGYPGHFYRLPFFCRAADS